MDTITYHLFECEEVKSFWNHVQLCILEKIQLKLSFTICEIIFGFSHSDDLIKVVNYIILCGKSYISKQQSLTIEKINECNKHFSSLFELLIVQLEA